MNSFTVVGNVVGYEEKSYSNGTFYILNVVADNEIVPLPCFRKPPNIGETVRVTGMLGSANGYLRLKKVEVEVIGGQFDPPAPPDVFGPENPVDDGLPF